MGAHPHRHQDVGVALLGHFGKCSRVAQLAQGHGVCGIDLGRRQAAHEQRLLAEHRLDRLTRLNCGNVEFGRTVRQHVARRVHLTDQWQQHRRSAHSGGAHRGDVYEIAAANAVRLGRAGGCNGGISGRSSVCHQPFCLAWAPAGQVGRGREFPE